MDRQCGGRSGTARANSEAGMGSSSGRWGLVVGEATIERGRGVGWAVRMKWSCDAETGWEKKACNWQRSEGNAG